MWSDTVALSIGTIIKVSYNVILFEKLIFFALICVHTEADKSGIKITRCFTILWSLHSAEFIRMDKQAKGSGYLLKILWPLSESSKVLPEHMHIFTADR